MAQFDMTKTVHNILSSRGDATQVAGTVIRTAADRAKMPGANVANLASLPGVGAAFGAVSAVGKAAQSLLPGAKPQAAAPRQIPRAEFNPFDLVAMRGAAAMAAKLMEIADRKGGNAGLADAISAVASLGNVVGEASGLAGGLAGDLTSQFTRGLVGEIVSEVVGTVGENVLGLVGLRQHALKLFITHHPVAHQQIQLEPIDVREPNLISRYKSQATPPEDQVSFWREDAQLNDHHGQWHAVYPPTPVSQPDKDNPRQLGDRNGELFAYMHMQMLARYDAERLGVGLDRVKPFDKYDAEIPEGYDPGERVMASSDGGKTWTHYRARPASSPGHPVTIGDIPADPPYPAAMIKDLETFRDAVRAAASQGYYDKIQDKKVVSIDNLGNTIEASDGSVDAPDNKNYGSLHSDGHTHFALFDNTPPIGVMLNLSATSRDPIFWRWHKHIDTIIQTCRETLTKKNPHDFSGGPPVTVRSQDIIVCGEEGLPTDVDGEELGAAVFGYSEVATENRWDTDFSSASATVALPGAKNVTLTTTAELSTTMRRRTIHPVDPTDPVNTQKVLSEDIDYLSHEDFSYFIRLQNHSEQAQRVTIRVFLAPEPWVEVNTAWIEMDRFLHQLAGHERAVVFRPARLSAVVRKPAVGYEELEGIKPRPPATAWCDCGWPYTLLLPRGTKEGLDFRLLVMLSSNDLTMDDTGQQCTSMSYCGLQNEKYPDKHPMGYPFDQPLTDSISSIIDKYDNWASRKIRIRWRS